MIDYSNFIPSMLNALAARLSSRLGLANRVNPAFSCVVTTVPGPQVPIYGTGAKMAASYGNGPVADGLGVFHVISSYWGQFTISTTCCREMMPAPEFYRKCLQSSFVELFASADPARKRQAS